MLWAQKQQNKTVTEAKSIRLTTELTESGWAVAAAAAAASCEGGWTKAFVYMHYSEYLIKAKVQTEQLKKEMSVRERC